MGCDATAATAFLKTATIQSTVNTEIVLKRRFSVFGSAVVCETIGKIWKTVSVSLKNTYQNTYFWSSASPTSVSNYKTAACGTQFSRIGDYSQWKTQDLYGVMGMMMVFQIFKVKVPRKSSFIIEWNIKEWKPGSRTKWNEKLYKQNLRDSLKKKLQHFQTCNSFKTKSKFGENCQILRE